MRVSSDLLEMVPVSARSPSPSLFVPKPGADDNDERRYMADLRRAICERLPASVLGACACYSLGYSDRRSRPGECFAQSPVVSELARAPLVKQRSQQFCGKSHESRCLAVPIPEAYQLVLGLDSKEVETFRLRASQVRMAVSLGPPLLSMNDGQHSSETS
jgi:hypothetical protein